MTLNIKNAIKPNMIIKEPVLRYQRVMFTLLSVKSFFLMLKFTVFNIPQAKNIFDNQVWILVIFCMWL